MFLDLHDISNARVGNIRRNCSLTPARKDKKKGKKEQILSNFRQKTSNAACLR